MPGNYLQKERIPYHHSHIPSVHSRKAGDCWPVDVALGPPLTDGESGKESSGKLSLWGETTSVRPLARNPSIVLLLCSPGLHACWAQLNLVCNAFHPCLASVCNLGKQENGDS